MGECPYCRKPEPEFVMDIEGVGLAYICTDAPILVVVPPTDPYGIVKVPIRHCPMCGRDLKKR